jgi:hypothetical protein
MELSKPLNASLELKRLERLVFGPVIGVCSFKLALYALSLVGRGLADIFQLEKKTV